MTDTDVGESIGTITKSLLSTGIFDEILTGYPPHLFEPDPPPIEYYCLKCELVSRCAVTIPCGCRFCKCCALNLTSQPPDIPCCDEQGDPTLYSPDYATRRKIENLLMTCPNKGCSDKFKCKEYDCHVSECKHRKVKSIRKECPENILRKDLNIHYENECQFTDVLCRFCDNLFRLSELPMHETKCQNALQSCPNNCNVNAAGFYDLDLHLQLECPEAEIRCIYGCNQTVPRKELKEHCQNSLDLHFQSLMEANETCLLRLTETQHMVQDCINNTQITQEQFKGLQTELTNCNMKSLQKLLTKQSDEISNLQRVVQNLAINKDLFEMKKKITPLQAKQNDIEDRLKRLELQSHGVGKGGSRHQTSVENQLGMQAITIANHDLKFEMLEQTHYGGVLVWKINDFARKKKDADTGKKTSLYSQPFYTSRFGYKMCARIFLNGDGLGKNTHVSLYLVIMKGDFDALLPWPFRQKVTLMLMDQQTHKSHLSESFIPDSASTSFSRPVKQMNIASGFPLFILQDVLHDTRYVMDDTAYFKIIVDLSDLYWP